MADDAADDDDDNINDAAAAAVADDINVVVDVDVDILVKQQRRQCRWQGVVSLSYCTYIIHCTRHTIIYIRRRRWQQQDSRSSITNKLYQYVYTYNNQHHH